MPRPRTEGSGRFDLRIPAATLDEVERAAKELGISVTAWLRLAIQQKLDHDFVARVRARERRKKRA